MRPSRRIRFRPGGPSACRVPRRSVFVTVPVPQHPSWTRPSPSASLTALVCSESNRLPPSERSRNHASADGSHRLRRERSTDDDRLFRRRRQRTLSKPPRRRGRHRSERQENSANGDSTRRSGNVGMGPPRFELRSYRPHRQRIPLPYGPANRTTTDPQLRTSFRDSATRLGDTPQCHLTLRRRPSHLSPARPPGRRRHGRRGSTPGRPRRPRVPRGRR
jgi:hypothetical protein